MRSIYSLGVITLVMVLAGGPAWAADPGQPGCGAPTYRLPVSAPCAPAPPAPTAPPAQQPAQQPGQQPTPAEQAAQPPTQDAFAQAPEAGTEAAASYAPNMIGDLLGYSAATPVSVSNPNAGFVRVVTPEGVFLSPINGNSSSSSTRTARFPIAARGNFKIADNESPMPQDRVFCTYNYYNDVNHSINGPGIPSMNVNLETVGFEKTFLDGSSSIGMRLPIFQRTGGSSVDQSEVGDLSVLFKYALYRDCQSGNVLSAGAVVTIPTGPDFTTVDGDVIHSTLIQPYVGYVWNQDRCYFHGFTSLAVPTDSRDVLLLFVDEAVGYWLYRENCSCGGMLTGIVPTVEAHANIPLNNEGAFHDPLGFSNQVVITTGVHFLFHRADLTVGCSVPVTGPLPYDIEAVAQFNCRF